MSAEFQAALGAAVETVEDALDAFLPKPDRQGVSDAESRLFAAMRHAALGGGKRLRAFFVIESARVAGAGAYGAARVAAAVECLHAYSLVHDDLPCMDDDDLRRGMPTVHKAYDEATAVLAGDALNTFAFEILAAVETHENPFVRCELVTRLAKAAGAAGMIGGQAIDLAAETAETPLNAQEVARLQHLKTGALISFSCHAGAILGQADEAHRRALEGYAHDLGLAFQIRDDLLDIEGDSAETGKGVRKDAAAGKATFVTLLGVEGARERAHMLARQAAKHLDVFDETANSLRAAAQFTVDRRA